MSKKRGNGEGSIHRRKDGGWCAQYTVYTSEGRNRRTLYGKTRHEVAAKLSKALADREGGLTFGAGRLTLGEYMTRWLSDSVRGTVRVSTYERQEQLFRGHIQPALGRLKLNCLTPAHVRGLISEKLETGLAPATVRKIHSTLHKALSQGVSNGLVLSQRRRCEGAPAHAQRDAAALGERGPHVLGRCPKVRRPLRASVCAGYHHGLETG